MTEPSDQSPPIDHGPRANESEFGGFDELAGEARHERSQRFNEIPSGSQVIGLRLPFTVGIVETEDVLLEVQALRQAAYGHHLPDLAASFGRPDPIDRLADVTIFYARDKSSGQLVGAARLQTNRSGPLQIERSLTLPQELRGRLVSEVTRLTILPGYVAPVRLALVKAIHLFCIANQIGAVVAGSRRSLLRVYLDLGFSDLFGDNRMVPLAHGSNLEHRILFRDTVTSEAESRARNHRDYDFVFRTFHPDIEVFHPVLGQTYRGIGIDERYSSKVA